MMSRPRLKNSKEKEERLKFLEKESLLPYSFNILPRNHKVPWKCIICGYEWKAIINNRIKGSNCPQCGRMKQSLSRKKSIPEGKKVKNYKTFMNFWDDCNVLDPNLLSYGSHSLVSLICPSCHYRFKRSPHSFKGCPVCSNRIALPGFNDLLTTHPNIAKMWDFKKNEKTPSNICAGSTKKFYWLCKNGHSSFCSVKQKVRDGISCKECSYRESSLERIVVDYIETIYSGKILRNTKPIVVDGKRLEIDVLLVDILLGFEIQDFGTHEKFENNIVSFKYGRNNPFMKKGPQYHERKRREFKRQLNVDIVDIWEDKIRDSTFQNDIIKEIKNRV